MSDYKTREIESLIQELRRTRRQIQSLDSWLDCLEACGLRNWDGYEEAQEMFEGEQDAN